MRMLLEHGHPFTDCSQNSVNLLQITSVVLQPDPIVEGRSVAILIEGTSHARIEAGRSNVQVMYNSFPVESSNLDLCSTVVSVGGCPLQAGKPFKLLHSVTVPVNIPIGDGYSASCVLSNSTTVFSCSQISFEVITGAPNTPSAEPVPTTIAPTVAIIEKESFGKKYLPYFIAIPCGVLIIVLLAICVYQRRVISSNNTISTLPQEITEMQVVYPNAALNDQKEIAV